MSRVTCQVFLEGGGDKALEPVGWGSVSNGGTLSSFKKIPLKYVTYSAQSKVIAGNKMNLIFTRMHRENNKSFHMQLFERDPLRPMKKYNLLLMNEKYTRTWFFFNLKKHLFKFCLGVVGFNILPVYSPMNLLANSRISARILIDKPHKNYFFFGGGVLLDFQLTINVVNSGWLVLI